MQKAAKELHIVFLFMFWFIFWVNEPIVTSIKGQKPKA